jgi:flavin reductase (DIM6/NTAB) family NADH-FMN oxidoreductase RutF
MAFVRLPVDGGLWERFHTVAPLVLVGTRDADGGFDLAPKHMAMPLSWDPWFGVVCAPAHRTWQNAVRTRVFTVSYLAPSHVVAGSLAAAPRLASGDKPSLAGVPTVPARTVEGVLVAGAVVALECALERTVDGLGSNGLLVGRVVDAHASSEALVLEDRDPGEQLAQAPLLAYVHPGRVAVVERTHAFPYHAGFRR